MAINFLGAKSLESSWRMAMIIGYWWATQLPEIIEWPGRTQSINLPMSHQSKILHILIFYVFINFYNVLIRCLQFLSGSFFHLILLAVFCCTGRPIALMELLSQVLQTLWINHLSWSTCSNKVNKQSWK